MRSAMRLLKFQRLTGSPRSSGLIPYTACSNATQAFCHQTEVPGDRRLAYFAFYSPSFLTTGYQLQTRMSRRNHDVAKQPEQKPVPVVQYDYVKKLVDSDFPNIVDVRDPQELQHDGKIPMTVNIPLGLISEAFALSPKELSGRYNLELKSHDDEIIFHCRSGKRSEVACILARNAGYRNVKNYEGSMLEWTEKNRKDHFF